MPRDLLLSFMQWYNEQVADEFHNILESDIDKFLDNDCYECSKHSFGYCIDCQEAG